MQTWKHRKVIIKADWHYKSGCERVEEHLMEFEKKTSQTVLNCKSYPVTKFAATPNQK